MRTMEQLDRRSQYSQDQHDDLMIYSVATCCVVPARVHAKAGEKVLN